MKPQSISRQAATLMRLSPLILLALGGCATPAPPPLTGVVLSPMDRQPADNPPFPDITALPAPNSDGAAEREYLTQTVIMPLMRFSLSQEAAGAAERQRADAVVAKVDAYNQSIEARAPAARIRRWWWPFGR